MFNMKSVGIKIALLRKERNLTQMELADMLNISYQAVSNWERGETMPDISKLPEIAQIFNTSIDYILGNESTTKLIKNIINSDLTNDIIDVEQFKDIAPILKPTQINKISSEISDIGNISDLIEYIPFVNKEFADKIAKKCIENKEILKEIPLDELVPFISKEYADKLVEEAIEIKYPINNLRNSIPFISETVADKIAKKCIEDKETLKEIILDELVPFISKEYADKLVEEAIELKYPINDLISVLPFVGSNIADKIAGKCIE